MDTYKIPRLENKALDVAKLRHDFNSAVSLLGTAHQHSHMKPEFKELAEQNFQEAFKRLTAIAAALGELSG